MRDFIFSVVSLIFILFPVAGFTGELQVPDVKGTWHMDIQSIAHDRPTSQPAQKLHVPLDTGIRTLDVQFQVIIDHQEGFRFSGFKTSDRRKEIITGVIGFDGKQIYMVDEDGIYTGTLVTPEKIEVIYLKVVPARSLAGRCVLTRAQNK